MDGLDGARVTEMWRYPVKSMRGERVDASEVDASGLRGDRAYAVLDVETGKVGSAKHPRLWADLLRCSARCTGEPADGAAPTVRITLPDGSETGSDDPDVDTRLSSVFGRPVRLCTVAPEGSTYLAVWPDIEGVIPDDFLAANSVAAEEAEGALTDIGLGLAAPGTFFDVSALHVVTEATLRRLGELAPESAFAVERYRPNLVLDAGDEPFVENGWTGGTATIGDALQATVLLPTMRCIMTTLAQGDLPRDANVLRTVAAHNRIELPGLGTWSCVGAYAAVTAPGAVQVGDAVTAA
jgi:uncharacterized protein YcbX